MALRDALRRALFEDAEGEDEELLDTSARPARPTAEPETMGKITRRIAGLGTVELKAHFDQALNEIGTQMDHFFKDFDRGHLDMIDVSLPVLVELRDEIENRYERQISEAETESAGIAPQAIGKQDGT